MIGLRQIQIFTFICLSITILISPINKVLGQSVYITSSFIFREAQLNTEICGCSIQTIGPSTSAYEGLSFGPDGNLYALAAAFPGIYDIYQIDVLTGNSTIIFTAPIFPVMFGFLSVGNGIFYSLPWGLADSDLVYRWDINSGSIVTIGATGFHSSGEMTISNGQIYYQAEDVISGHLSIIHLDTLNPANSELVISYPINDLMVGLTASPHCNTLIGKHGYTNELVYFSLIDGAMTPVCDLGEVQGHVIASPLEYAPLDCDVTLDLDCDDSSGATGADYNSPDFDCLSNGVDIADDDVRLFYDAIISEMTIQVAGFMPDAPYEIVEMTGSVAGINATGSGTDMITLSNAGGAKSTDFIDALHLVVYNNISGYPTGGLRTVEVQFTTESGMSSNISTAFIQVNELERVQVDLGPDLEICEGETATFDAGNPGAVYYWSTGQHSQTITVGTAGIYIVTVSNGVECPNKDTIELDVLPIIHVSLIGDSDICDNEQASLTIVTDAPFPIDIEITPDPGTPFTFTDVIGDFNFFDLPSGVTEYTITNVIPSEPACVEITDPSQVVYVYPTYITSTDVSICDGDSIWLGYYWEDQAGQYEILYYTVDGCDSTVNYTLSVLPAVNISMQSTTCDSSELGVFIIYLNNPFGCDTVVQTTVTLLPADTTLISLVSCNISNAGSTTQTLTNQAGCDSMIITTTNWIPPADTTRLYQQSCDSSSLGIFQQILTAHDGCDSLVTTTVTMAPLDTTYVNSTSCDSANLGVFEQHYNSQLGCDSLMITTVAYAISHYSYIYATSCDSNDLGIYYDTLTAIDGCDSTVIQTVTYSAEDSTFIAGTTCDPADAGVFIKNLVNTFGCDSIVTTQISILPSSESFISSETCDTALTGNFDYLYVNQFGCDSIVHETISLLPSSETFLSSTTCSSSEAGVFITALQNQYGCDSIVTHTISLLPADTTIVSFKTCFPNQVGHIENTYVASNGCDSLVIEITELFPLPIINIEVTSDFNGFDISCYGVSDGNAMAEVTGVGPLNYLWSTGSIDQSITALSAGSYSVTVTDGNGCIAEGEVILSEPEVFEISLSISPPDCFDQKNGIITVLPTGGVQPFRYSIDGINYQTSPTFTGLSGGTYEITALDANDCEEKEIIWINVPLMVHVDLGDDQTIHFGDTAIIEAIVNIPFDSLSSIVWTGLNNPDCPNCLTQPVVQIITTSYSVSVISVDGCEDEDSMTLFVEKNEDIYIPNIFSPNGDGINDRLLINAGSDVEEISSLMIYDRWGNLVYSADHFPPNDLNYSWDGTLKGSAMNSAVFAYRLIAVLKDGRQQIRVGDVTLVR